MPFHISNRQTNDKLARRALVLSAGV
jgi:hypothetical protein